MSFGDSEPAPTYYFSGILFNPSFYTSSSSDYLTQTTAKKYFLSYPSAQGTETISNLISNAITYSSPTSGSFFEVGVNQVSGGTIRIGPTGSSAGVSVHCGNVDFKNNTINNATAATTGDLSIASAQTQGVLNIATASRVKASGTTKGDINIGTGINTLVSGTIYPYINIGNNPSTLNGTQISMGAVNTTTTINGKLTSSRGVLSGNTVYAVYDSFGGNQTISTSLNVDAFIVIFGGLGSSIFTIPSGFPTGQRLTFKSIASNNQTLRFTNTISILSNGTQTGASDFAFPQATVLNVIFNGTLWYQT